MLPLIIAAALLALLAPTGTDSLGYTIPAWTRAAYAVPCAGVPCAIRFPVLDVRYGIGIVVDDWRNE